MDVQVCREIDHEWSVRLDEVVVARFIWVGDALDYAELLGCSPRARAAAKAARLHQAI